MFLDSSGLKREDILQLIELSKNKYNHKYNHKMFR